MGRGLVHHPQILYGWPYVAKVMGEPTLWVVGWFTTPNLISSKNMGQFWKSEIKKKKKKHVCHMCEWIGHIANFLYFVRVYCQFFNIGDQIANEMKH
jgi:hypothetical protein